MKQVDDLSRSLGAFDQEAAVIAVIELSNASWLVAGTLPGAARRPLKKLDPDPKELEKLLLRWRGETEAAGRRPTAKAEEFGQSLGNDRRHGRCRSRSEVAVTRGTPWLQSRGKNVPAAPEPRTRSEWLLHGPGPSGPNRIQARGAIPRARLRAPLGSGSQALAKNRMPVVRCRLEDWLEHGAPYLECIGERKPPPCRLPRCLGDPPFLKMSIAAEEGDRRAA